MISRLVLPADEWEGPSAPSSAPATPDMHRLLLEGRRTKAAKAFTLTLYSVKGGKRRAPVGKIVCPSSGVFAASPTFLPNAGTSERPLPGSRLCTEVKEGGDRVLSLSAVLPTDYAAGNLDAHKVRQHRQDTCPGSLSLDHIKWSHRVAGKP